MKFMVVVATRSVGMDGMNKTPQGGVGERPVAMDGMNKHPSGGVGDDAKDKQISDHATVIPTIPPRDLQEFSTSSIINTPEDLPERKPPLGPYITSKDIKLSEGEFKLLSRDPKFSLIFPPDRTKLSIETERMTSKIRYNDRAVAYDRTTSNRARITDKDGVPIEWNIKSNPKLADIDINRRTDVLGDTLGQL